MKKGPELLKWAEQRAKEATANDFDLIGVSGFTATTAAIAEAYMLGGIDALADEIARIRSQGAISQADGSAG